MSQLKSEKELKERIKELTCLYEVTSILVNARNKKLSDTLQVLKLTLKKAFQYPNKTNIYFQIEGISNSEINKKKSNTIIESPIIILNKKKGKLIAELIIKGKNNITFLNEEQLLLDNVALKIGNYLEVLEIQKNELSLKRQMEHADRLSILGEITAGIAHELNTPLANILGFAELLKDDFKDNKNIVKDLDKIIENAIFSREVVKKLMFFACKMPQEIKTINVVPYLKNAVNLLSATFKKKEVKYIIKIENETMFLNVDPLQLQQIIFNLLINATYFTPKDGLITIEAKETASDFVLIISDEGKGIAENELDKVFEPFYTTKPIGEGTGLGLSVVHGIVNSHNGTITVSNNINKGAVFTIKLPKKNL